MATPNGVKRSRATTRNTKSLVPDKDVAVAWLPKRKDEKYNPEDFKLGEVLASCNSLYPQLDRIRTSLGITLLMKWPPSPTSETIAAIIRESNELYNQALEQWAEWLAYRYRLSANWNVPLRIAILCHVLPVPSDPAIGLYVPPGAGGRGGVFEAMRRQRIAKSEAIKLLNSPLIYPNYQVSINELLDFIKNHSAEISSALAQLPPKPSAGKTTRNRLLIGHLAWLIKNHRAGIKTWGDVATFLTDEILGEGEAMDEIEARKLAYIFVRQQKRVDV